MTDFGTDISCLPDLDPLMIVQTAPAKVLGEAIARRFQTRREGLPGVPNYGRDLRLYLGAAMTPATLSRMRSEIEQECLGDERIQSATAVVTFTSATQKLGVSIKLETAEGPFSLVLEVSKLTVALLSSEAA